MMRVRNLYRYKGFEITQHEDRDDNFGSVWGLSRVRSHEAKVIAWLLRFGHFRSLIGAGSCYGCDPDGTHLCERWGRVEVQVEIECKRGRPVPHGKVLAALKQLRAAIDKWIEARERVRPYVRTMLQELRKR